MHFAADKPALI